MEKLQQPRGMHAFTVIWVGQLLSLVGTAMTNFALPIYVFGKTERIQELALLGMAFMLPLILLSPFAGVLVDRYSRKAILIASDVASGLMTAIILFLVTTDQLQIWHLYITIAVSGAFQSLQWPAFSAAISVMLSKEQYGRANGMMSLAESGSTILAPVFAAALLGLVGLRGVLLIDVATFLFAVTALAVVHIPGPPRTAEGAEGQGSFFGEAAYGFRYILRRRSLLGLQLFFMSANFLSSIAMVMLVPLILSRTGQNELVLGTAQSIAGIGGVAGGLAMSAWGGPRKRVHGVFLGWFVSAIGLTLMGFGRGVLLWAVAGFIMLAMGPIINGSNQAIWQAKVAPDVQGRVFAIRRLIAWLTVPLAQLAAIPLADSLLGPAMLTGGALVPVFGPVVGVGPGAGISLVMIVSGLLIASLSLSAYLIPTLRDAELLLPDHMATGGDQPAGAGSENMTPVQAQA